MVVNTDAGNDALSQARDALFYVAHRAKYFALDVEQLERRYEGYSRELTCEYFYVPTDSHTGLALDASEQDRAPHWELEVRKQAVLSTLKLRESIHNAMRIIPSVSPWMDGHMQPAVQRWTFQTIDILRELLAAILKGHSRELCPSALPMIRVGVPAAVREAGEKVWHRMEDLKSTIVASLPHSLAGDLEAPDDSDERKDTPSPPKTNASEPATKQAVPRAAEPEATLGGKSQAAKLPESQPLDRQAWQLWKLAGKNQAEVARLLNSEHGTSFEQGQISRMCKRFQKYIEAGGLADELPKPAQRERAADPARLELGARVDKRKPRPSDMARENDDGQ